MKTTVSNSDFHDAFRSHDRMENFSYEGRNLLFEYLEQIEEDTGEEMELDVIAICCDFNEDTVEDIASNYNINTSDAESESEKCQIVTDYLNDNTLVVGSPSDCTIVYQVF